VSSGKTGLDVTPAVAVKGGVAAQIDRRDRER